jgi:Helix-turn-helix domain
MTSAHPHVEQGNRLRWLRQAEGFRTGVEFAAWLGWPQSSYTQFENGRRRVPMDKALQLRTKIPGFCPLWLWEGDAHGLSFDLLKRITAEQDREREMGDRLAAHGTG